MEEIAKYMAMIIQMEVRDPDTGKMYLIHAGLNQVLTPR